MLRRTLISLGLVLCLIAFGTTAAYSSGYPVGALGTISDSSLTGTPISVIVLGKFDSSASGFTFDEAEQISQQVMSLISQLLPTNDFMIFTPSALSAPAIGLGDADAAKTFIANNYKSAGIDVFVFLDIKKASAVVAALGPNIRIDLYLSASGPISNVYIASVETPLAYADLLGNMISGL